MQITRLAGSGPGLAHYVRSYMQLQGHLGTTSVLHPVPARATALLEFQFGDTNEAHWCNRPVVEKSKPVQIIGLQTHRRVQLRFSGSVEVFLILFQPTGLHRMFSLPMHELTSTHNEARAVLGAGIDQLTGRLSEARSFEERVRIANAFFLKRCSDQQQPDRVTVAALSILNRRGQVEIPALAQQACMSARQFERRFQREIGLPPKLFSRIARFEAALESKALSAAESWTEVTARLGYYDQMHLIKDFKEFSGEVPSRLLAVLESEYDSHLAEIRAGRRPATSGSAPQLLL